VRQTGSEGGCYDLIIVGLVDPRPPVMCPEICRPIKSECLVAKLEAPTGSRV